MADNDSTNAAIVNAAGNLSANIVGNSGRRKAQERAEAANLRFWNLQNEYNSPTAQMARLREAGLNPNMIYGSNSSGASGAADKIAPAKAAEFNIDNPLREINSIAATRNTSAQTDNLRAQNTVMVQEAALKGAQASEIGVRTARGKFELGLAKELRETSLEASRENLRQMENKTLQIDLDNQFKSASLKNMIKDTFYRAKIARATLTGKDRDNELKRLDIELKRLGIEKGDPW